MTGFQRPALDLIAELRRGKTANDLTEKVHDLIAACIDTGKKGELVLKLTFEPDPDDETRMKVTDQVAAKVPARTVKPSLFFLTDGGNLTRSDPLQQDLLPGTGGVRAVPNHDDSTDNADRKAN